MQPCRFILTLSQAIGDIAWPSTPGCVYSSWSPLMHSGSRTMCCMSATCSRPSQGPNTHSLPSIGRGMYSRDQASVMSIPQPFWQQYHQASVTSIPQRFWKQYPFHVLRAGEKSRALMNSNVTVLTALIDSPRIPKPTARPTPTR